MVLTEDKGVMVFRKDGTSKNGKEYTLYSLNISSKGADGNWVNAYLDCAFKKGLPEVFNKAKIKINNAFPKANSYGGKTTVKWMITDMEIIEPGEAPEQKKENYSEPSTMNFMDIPEGIDEELPFA